MTDDRGFAAPVLVVMLALAALLCIATADAANVLVQRARAQTAADAAALAAATARWSGDEDAQDPATAAEETAADNGAELVSCACDDRPTVVVVAMPTRIRMLGVAPSTVEATAVADVDLARLFEPPS